GRRDADQAEAGREQHQRHQDAVGRELAVTGGGASGLHRAHRQRIGGGGDQHHGGAGGAQTQAVDDAEQPGSGEPEMVVDEITRRVERGGGDQRGKRDRQGESDGRFEDGGVGSGADAPRPAARGGY